MTAQEVGLGGRGAFDEVEPLVEGDDPGLRLGVRAGGVELRERVVADELDRRLPQARSASRRDRALSPSSAAWADASAQVGGVGSSAGSGALASIVAIRR